VSLFNKSNPLKQEIVAINVAEVLFLNPVEDKQLKEFVSDTYKLGKDPTADLHEISEI
jgi:hypothetical protein